MARPPAQSAPTQPKANTNRFIPKATDPRAELFYLLGGLQAAGIETGARITELVIDLTLPAPATEGE